MCIAFPGKIISIDENGIALIDIGGTRREASLDIIDEDVSIGDYVICHAGFAIHKVDEQHAKESLELLKDILEHEIY
ncbi:MAG: HypC/HybG/HupF family hydrogenase formation chaperone [Desulfomonilia bacterium]